MHTSKAADASAGTGTDQHHDHDKQRARQTQTLTALRSRRASLQSSGVQGWDLFEQMATLAITHRVETERTNRCAKCWHDKVAGCICDLMPSLRAELDTADTSCITTIPCLPNVKLLILMHHKEYLCAGNSAKLLLQMLPEERIELYIFGRTGDLDRLSSEIAVDPVHTFTLWPGEQSKTIGEYIDSLPDDSSWRMHEEQATDKFVEPLLRVIALDGTYSNAKHMHKTLRKRLGDHAPQHVALHPTTMSIFRRAQKHYGASVAKSLKGNSKLDNNAMRVSTAEACALLLTELGAAKEVKDRILEAVALNNRALSHDIIDGWK